MKLTDYEVNIELSEEVKKIAYQEAFNATPYNNFGYYGSNSIQSILDKITSNASFGPQRSKKLSSNLKRQIEELIGGLTANSGCILWCDPHFIIKPHIDVECNGRRKSCLTWVIYPEPAFVANTLFYNENNNIISRYSYSKKAFILDTRIKHGMVNNEYSRVVVQLMFDIETAILKNKIES